VIAGMLDWPAFQERGLSAIWFEPEPGGRDQTYRRDFELVSAADRVIAYFSEDHVMEGGTGHVVEAALARNIPVEAWSFDDAGRKRRVGELDTM